uniref:Phospholipid-transporting ATPase n=1 Tax=Rhizochromulina marina TaxID=1034831 RepID=A0A7S2WGS7_9STRA|mmetsp:Transcript_23913/g.70135  ORF Transcript_23913/g.70135 Transcript_23913/m.70135 type:complete len:1205 (+) Transcript_23913:147-3761(+)
MSGLVELPEIEHGGLSDLGGDGHGGLAFRQIFIGDEERTESELAREPSKGGGTRDNLVVTSLYTWWNFIPLNLWKQFQRRQNVYFLFISILQTIDKISITLGVPTVLPILLLLLLITAVKDGIEDFHRHQADREENGRCAHVINLKSDIAADTSWRDVKVGDVIEIRNRELIPADVVLLQSSDENGLCFVMTANLDGETNLKLRKVSANMHGSTHGVGCSLRSELPNNHLSTFEGTFRDEKGDNHPLSNENVLLRGTQLKNSLWVRGLVVFTGRESKIQMNAAKPPHKMSSMTVLANTETLIIFLVQCGFCLLCGILAGLFADRSAVKRMTYIWGYRGDDISKEPLTPQDIDNSSVEIGIIKFWTFILIFTNFIPIAHVVSLDLVKIVQAVMMKYDLRCYHEVTDDFGETTRFPLDVRSSELNEELGLVEYVFSDKTGTLTCNVMEFRKCSIQGISYGLGTTEIGLAYRIRNNLPIPPDPAPIPGALKIKHVNFVDPALDAVINDRNHPRNQGVHEFLLSLALNHEAMPEQHRGEVIISASNPDEAAFVYFAKSYGRSFLRRVRGDFEEMTVDVEGEEIKFRILHTLEFDSERKRSSVLVRMADGTVVLFCKGADNVILERLSKDPAVNPPELVRTTEQHISEYVNDGLRTLLVAQAIIPLDVYEDWATRMHEADVALAKRQERRFAVMDEIEQNLKLIGATAIEDKLQDGVGDAISSLRTAGIRVWMLTGDKVGTAENIAYSCQLITKQMLQLRLVAGEGDLKPLNAKGLPPNKTLRPQLQTLVDLRLAGRKADPRGEACLIVDAAALTALEDAMQADETLTSLFLELASMVKSVICARVSPKQKAQIVGMVRKKMPSVVTLSIGDGANDVPMIQTAHIGIGIFGLEGQQAVNASDYAIGQFRFLKSLLLVHGRWNLRRCALLTLYLFYKNAVLVLPQFYFGFYSLMSGQNFYYDFMYQVFNTFFTGLPIFVVSSFDQDASATVALAYPQLYKDGIERRFITHRIFWTWMIEGMLHGAIVMFVPLAAVGSFNIFENGQVMGLWEYGLLVMFLDVMVAQLRLGIETAYWTGMETVAYVVSVGIWWYVWYMGSKFVEFPFIPLFLGSYTIQGTYSELADNPAWWLITLVSLVLCMLPTFTFQAVKAIYAPSRSTIGREITKGYFNGVFKSDRIHGAATGKRTPAFGESEEQGFLAGTFRQESKAP